MQVARASKENVDQGAYTQTQKQPSTGKKKEGDVTEDRLHEVAAGRAINRSTTKLQTTFEKLRVTFEMKKLN